MASAKEQYEDKFADFIRMCVEAKKQGADVVVVAHPHVLGDDYDELIESLSRLAESDLQLSIAEPSPRRPFRPENN